MASFLTNALKSQLTGIVGAVSGATMAASQSTQSSSAQTATASSSSPSRAGRSTQLPTSQGQQASPTSPVPRPVPTSPRLGAARMLVPVRSASSAAIDNRPWTVHDIGQNNIASLLNDPTTPGLLLTQKLELGKQTAVARAVIKNVRSKDFDRYLADVGPVYARYLEAKSTAFEGDPILFDQETAMAIKDSLLLSTANANGVPVAPPPLPSSTPRRATGLAKVKDQLGGADAVTADPMQAIPAVFFEPDFTLENPRIFDLVTEYANVASAVPSIGDLAGATTNSVLQEKLSHYLDTVEVQLVAEISQRSLEFFAALANIQSLHAETLQCLTHIRQVRASLARVDDNQAKKGLEIVRQKKRRNNLNLLFTATKMVQEVKRTQPTIQVLLNQGDYVGALELITETSRMLRGGSGPAGGWEGSGAVHGTRNALGRRPNSKSIQLNGVRGLVHLGGQLTEMSKMIASLMENDFIHVIMTDMNQHLVHSQDPKTPHHIWAMSVLNATAVLDVVKFVTDDLNREENLRTNLTPLVLGLIRTDRLGTALQTYKDRLTKLVKAITKQFLPPPLPGEKETGDAEGPLAKRFKSMTFDDFMKMMVSVFVSLLLFQRRIAFANEMLILIVRDSERHGIAIGVDKNIMSDEAAGPAGEADKAEKPLISPVSMSDDSSTLYSHLTSEIAEILFNASDLAHVRCGKLLTLRAEQNAQLNLKDFFRLYQLTNQFLTAGELICQRSCIGLRGTLMTQLTMLIDHEVWSQAEVPIEFQHIVNKVTGQSMISRALAIDSSVLEMDLVPDAAADDEKQKDDEESTPSRPNMQNYLLVDDSQYHVVPCALLFVKMLEDYLSTVEKIPVVAPDVLNRVAEIAKLFNSRVCGVIVGGAAVQSSVLKSITAKHLALAGQSLGFVMALLPHVKKRIEEQLPEKQKMLSAELDRVITDLKNNQEQVFHRIIMIMEDRLTTHIASIPMTQWDAEPSAGTEDVRIEPSPYMKALVKETVKLHRILTKYLLPDGVKTIFAQVFHVYDKQLELELNKLDLFTSAGKNKVLLDIQYYVHVLSSLVHIDGPGNHLEVVVNNIRIKDRREKSAFSAISTAAKGVASAANIVHPLNPPVTGSNSAQPARPGGSIADAAASQARKLGSTVSSAFNFTSFANKMTAKPDIPSAFGLSKPTADSSKTASPKPPDKTPTPSVSACAPTPDPSYLVQPSALGLGVQAMGAAGSGRVSPASSGNTKGAPGAGKSLPPMPPPSILE